MAFEEVVGLRTGEGDTVPLGVPVPLPSREKVAFPTVAEGVELPEKEEPALGEGEAVPLALAEVLKLTVVLTVAVEHAVEEGVGLCEEDTVEEPLSAAPPGPPEGVLSSGGSQTQRLNKGELSKRSYLSSPLFSNT